MDDPRTSDSASSVRARLAELAALEAPFRFLREPGPWLWTAIALGFALRLYMAFFTEGTLDVVVWEGHAREVRAKGLVAYYHGGMYQFNHPPLMGLTFALFRDLAQATGIPFELLLRLPFALLDAGTALLLLRVMNGSTHRHVVAVLYWLHPLAIILSSFHGNTDSAIAFFLLASSLCVARGRPIAAGALLGLSLWIKVPGVLGLPVLLFALPDWRARGRFVAAWGGVGILTYVPVLVQDARVVIDSVFLYSGLRIQTQAGIPVWGIQGLLPAPSSLPLDWRGSYRELLLFFLRNNTLIAFVPIVLVAWCRRGERDARGIVRNLGRTYVILYGFTNFWAFQYPAWSLPCWLVMGAGFALASSAVTTAYIYGLYAWLCQNLLLLGEWDFIGRSIWPIWLTGLRDTANLFFFVAAWVIIFGALRTLRPAHPRSGDQEATTG